MHEVLLQNYYPAFGLLPDLAMLVLHPPFGETASPPDHHWTLEPPPAAVDAAYEPNFAFDILQRIQAQINRRRPANTPCLLNYYRVSGAQR